MKKQLIIDIKGNSLDDGHGIRSVIFLKGCPLNCVWCHNPESKLSNALLSFDPDICVSCGQCRKVCPNMALSPKNPFFINRDKCNQCLRCVDGCPTGAMSVCGKFYDDDELLNLLLKDKPFYDTSGGGVTISGGEPTLNIDYLSHILKLIKSHNIDVLLETCGFFDYNGFEQKVLPYVDHIYMDIKLYNEQSHIKYCGVSNKIILQNFSTLNSFFNANPNKILPRVPLIPNITDTDINLTEIADFLVKNNVKKSELLPYNPLWESKNFKIGIDCPSIQKGFTPNEKIKRCKDIFINKGVMV